MSWFPFPLYFLAFAGATLAAGISLPLWRSWCLRQNLVDDPGHRKIHTAPVPLAGGLAVVTGVCLPLAAGLLLLASGWLAELPAGSRPAMPLLNYGVQARPFQLAAILGGALAMLLLGFLDDRFEMKPAVKFGGQLLIALAVAASGIRITLFVENALFSYLVTCLWILTVTNAMNFMDNMNGLTTGLSVIASWSFAWAAAMQGQYLVSLLGFLTCGAALGFLPHNFPSATAFLGDAGSHLLGFLLSLLAILPNYYSAQTPNALAVLTPLIVLAVPLGDLIWVVCIRWKLGQPFYVGDTNHLSHRLVRKGHPLRRTVLLIWLMSALAAALPTLLRI